MKVIAIIPARIGSTRLPGKPLIKIKGKPLIQYVWENTASPLIDFKIIATDDITIFQTVKGFGGEAVMTHPHHNNGSERCAEVIQNFPGYDLILNIQGDEPMVNEKVISGLVEPFIDHPQTEVTTLKTFIPHQKQQDIENSHIVKVVTDPRGYALYFSRSPIPYNREQSPITYYKHLGFYAFRRESLLRYMKLPPTPLENIEKLEQLRFLEYRFPIYVSEFQGELIDINTPKDLQKFEKKLG